MTIEAIKSTIPDYAKDIRLNLSAIATEPGSPDLSQKQIDITMLAVAVATKNKHVINAIQNEVAARLTDIEKNAAKAAATIMAMNNIYYRFTHLVSDQSFATMPAKLRMSVIVNSGIDKVDFELAALAVSALNGCGMCMDAHAGVLVKAGVTKAGIQSAVRIAAVLNSVAIFDSKIPC